MSRSLIVVALLLVAPLAVAQQIYKWTDAKGTVHYSQSAPPEGTRFQQVKLAGGVESADASAAQCLAHSARSAAVCFICGHVDAIAVSAAEVLMAITGPIAPSGMVQT